MLVFDFSIAAPLNFVKGSTLGGSRPSDAAKSSENHGPSKKPKLASSTSSKRRSRLDEDDDDFQTRAADSDEEGDEDDVQAREDEMLVRQFRAKQRAKLGLPAEEAEEVEVEDAVAAMQEQDNETKKSFAKSSGSFLPGLGDYSDDDDEEQQSQQSSTPSSSSIPASSSSVPMASKPRRRYDEDEDEEEDAGRPRFGAAMFGGLQGGVVQSSSSTSGSNVFPSASICITNY